MLKAKVKANIKANVKEYDILWNKIEIFNINTLNLTSLFKKNKQIGYNVNVTIMKWRLNYYYDKFYEMILKSKL